MDQAAGLAGIAIVLFVATNIDDLFVLLGFFVDPQLQARDIAIGTFAGMGVLYGLSVVASLVSLVVAPPYIGLLGVVPVMMGLKKLWNLRRDAGRVAADPPQKDAIAAPGSIAAVAAVTIANGGDNISIYTPLFATYSAAELVIVGVVFALMTLAWVAGARWLTAHRTLGAPIRRYGYPLIPFVLIALGIFILYEAGSFGLLTDLAISPPATSR